MPTLRELVLLGQVRVEREGNVAITNAAPGSVLVPFNPLRVHLSVVNHEANLARVTRAQEPTTSVGLPLDANGGAFSEDVETFGKTLCDQRRAILATAAGNLWVEALEAYLLPGQVLT